MNRCFNCGQKVPPYSTGLSEVAVRMRGLPVLSSRHPRVPQSAIPTLIISPTPYNFKGQAQLAAGMSPSEIIRGGRLGHTCIKQHGKAGLVYKAGVMAAHTHAIKHVPCGYRTMSPSGPPLWARHQSREPAAGRQAGAPRVGRRKAGQ